MKKVNILLSILIISGFLVNSAYSGGICSKNVNCCDKDNSPQTSQKNNVLKILITSEKDESVEFLPEEQFLAFKFDGLINKGSDRYKYLQDLNISEYKSVDLRKVSDFKYLKSLFCFQPKYIKYLQFIVDINHQKYSKKSVVGAENIFDSINNGNLNDVYKFASQINSCKENNPLKGSSPLLYAVENKASLEVISLLLLLGADVRAYEEDGDGRNLILSNLPTEDMYYCKDVLERLLASRLNLTDSDVIKFPFSNKDLFLTKFKNMKFFKELYEHFEKYPEDRTTLMLFPFINNGINYRCITPKNIFQAIDIKNMYSIYEFRSEINGLKDTNEKNKIEDKYNRDFEALPLHYALEVGVPVNFIAMMLLLGADVNLKEKFEGKEEDVLNILSLKKGFYLNTVLNMFLTCGLKLSDNEYKKLIDGGKL